ncbi:MAG: spore germination protein [Oscillospiraceae bacterium]|nr:spore germination protein [Oscillospiraceae bacterium]
MKGIINSIKDYLLFTPAAQDDIFNLSLKKKNAEYDVRDEKEESTATDTVSDNIEQNLSYVRKRFTYPINNDIVIREIKMKQGRKAFIVLIDGMVSSELVDLAVIKTMLEIPFFSDNQIYKYEDEIIEKFIAHSQAFSTNSMDTVFEEINFGSCAVFVDGFSKAFILDVRDWGHRGIDKPENEQSIYGPQEAFSEMLRNNTALVRKIIKSEKLIAEGIKVGKISKTRGVMLYISDIANPGLVDEVRRRLNGITMDYVISIEEIAMMMEENTFSTMTHFMETERPDRVARALTEGRVAFILNGNPQVLVMPTNIFELTHAVSDDYIRVPYANMVRIIRMIAVLFSVLLPGLYLAITLFHQEIIPTYLLYSISASRENVPFPSILELLLMDLSFEMIREAGLRMPGPIGSTLGIVGGLILGQAAVSAKIVSPIMIIIIAITGIGSFATADYSLSWSLRVLRLIFVILGSTMGFYGIAIGLFIYGLSLASQKSFGVSFLEPVFKLKNNSMANAIFVNPVWKRENRPDFLDPKNTEEEPKISRKWKTKRQ